MFKEQKQPDDDYDQHSEGSNQSLGQNDYGSVQYWEQRYIKTNGQRFDWLESFQSLKNLIIRQIGESKNKKILNVGCGNGEIQDHLYDAGYRQIYNNDISKEVIKQMNQIKDKKGQTDMIYEVMDVTKMTYPEKYFDLVLDKSTIDALLCSEHPYIQSAKMLEEIERVLKDDGIYLAVSYGSPQSRMKHFKRQHISFDIKMEQLVRLNEKGDKLIHYAYICKKLPKEGKDNAWKQQFYKRLMKEENQYYDNDYDGDA